MAAVTLMQQARIAIREGRLVDARRLLRQVIREEPYNHAAWLLLARATPDKKVAAQYIDRARHLQPDSPLVQRAEDDLVSNNKVGSNRYKFSWHFALLLVGIALIVGLVTASFSEGAWEQVIALQNDGADGIVSAPIESNQDKSMSVPQAVSDAGEMASSDLQNISVPKLTEGTNSPEASPTTDISEKRENATRPIEDSDKAQESIYQPLVIIDPDQALPAAILSGIGAEASSSKNKEMATALDASVVSSQESAMDEESGVETGNESEIIDVGEVEEEMQDLATIENEVIAEENATIFDPAEIVPGERWIDVDLTTQTLVAYEGDTPVLHSLVSSGMWQFPTITGQFRTWIKYDTQDMTGYHLGYNYSLDNVPHVMYFFEDYAIHGAYWHNNFGTPMSHGCVNVNLADAEWLYNWAPVGTIVNVHQ